MLNLLACAMFSMKPEISRFHVEGLQRRGKKKCSNIEISRNDPLAH